METVVNNLPDGELVIRSMLHSLKPAEKRVAEYVLDHLAEVIHLSITSLANYAGVSEGTIVKLCQKMGYSGYQDFKIHLARSIDKQENKEEYIYDEIKAGDGMELILDKTFKIYEESFNNTKKMLKSSDLDLCVKMILETRRLFFFGFGASGIVALDGELKFKRINYLAEALTDNHTQKTVGALLDERDLVVAISNSGRTRELIEALEIVEKTGARIIVITSNLGSPLTQYADSILITSSMETPFRGSAIASRMAQLAIIDLLFLGVATIEYNKTVGALEKTRLTMSSSKI